MDNDPIASYIANEEAKIKALRVEADSRERNLTVFKTAYRNMQGPDVIDLNARVRPTSRPQQEHPLPNLHIERKAAPQPPLGPQFEHAATSAEPPQQKRQMHKKGEARAAVLRPLADGAPKKLAEVQDGVARQGYGLSYNHVRTELWTMKNEGLTTSPGAGVYQITEKGLAFLQGQKGESPAATGLSSATVSGSDLA